MSREPVHRLDARETYFGAIPESVTFRSPIAQSWGSRFAALPGHFGRLLSRRHGASHEPVVATLGSVEIRQISAARVAQTCVKGGASQARATALRRLARYASGDNQGAASLRVERTVTQIQIEPHRWLVSVRLSDQETTNAPLAPKVRMIEWRSETLAVLHIDGRPNEDLISFGDAIILDAIDGSEWIAIGSPRIRLTAPRWLPWLTTGFEVVVPVSARGTKIPMV